MGGGLCEAFTGLNKSPNLVCNCAPPPGSIDSGAQVGGFPLPLALKAPTYPPHDFDRGEFVTWPAPSPSGGQEEQRGIQPSASHVHLANACCKACWVNTSPAKLYLKCIVCPSPCGAESSDSPGLLVPGTRWLDAARWLAQSCACKSWALSC